MISNTKNNTNNRFFLDTSFVLYKRYNSVWNEKLPVLLSILLFLLFCFFYLRGIQENEFYSTILSIFMIITSVFTFVEFLSRRNEYISISKGGIEIYEDKKNNFINWNDIKEVKSFSNYIVIYTKENNSYRINYLSYKGKEIIKNTIAYVLKEIYINYDGEDMTDYDMEVIFNK